MGTLSCQAIKTGINIMIMGGFKTQAVVLPLVVLSWFVSGPADALPAKEQVRFGIMVARRGLWSEARFRFERAVALDPEYAAAYNNLAVALEQLGEFDGAREAYQKALALKPKNRNIQQNFELFQDADRKRKRKLDDKETTKDAS
jgi:tetratricopeptide (TPR) repeat protein